MIDYPLRVKLKMCKNEDANLITQSHFYTFYKLTFYINYLTLQALPTSRFFHLHCFQTVKEYLHE